MANSNPIGITFLPSEENQSLGPKRGGLESDLGQAFKILSLRLPRVQGARAIAPPNLLNGPGSSGMQNPQAAAFEQMIRAMLGQGGPTSSAGPFDRAPMGAPPVPNITPGKDPAAARAPFAPAIEQPPMPPRRSGGGPLAREY